MGSTNHGTQEITYQYFEEAKAEDFNKRHLDIRPRGIYSGGYLTRVSDVSVTLSTFSAEIGDDAEQVSVQTSTVATLTAATLDSGTISISTPYLILRWNFLSQKNNYVEVHAIATVASALTNDIIIGKCVFSGSTLTGFEYTDRTFLNVQDLFFKVETSTGLYVQLRAGRIHTGSQSIFVPEQLVGPFSVPSAPNSRVDLVYIADTGTPTIQQGTVGVTPVAPSYGGKTVVAEITVVNGVTSIAADKIKDVRAFITKPPIPDNIGIELTSAGLLSLKNSFSSIATNGYIHIPGTTLIIQWGSVVVNINSAVDVNLPKEYPTSHLWATARPESVATHVSINENASTGAVPLSTTKIRVRNGSGTGPARTMYWFSLGH
jgi:hypothetical protein